MSPSYEVGVGVGPLSPVRDPMRASGTSIRGAGGRAGTLRTMIQRVAVSMGVRLRTIAPDRVRYR